MHFIFGCVEKSHAKNWTKVVYITTWTLLYYYLIRSTTEVLRTTVVLCEKVGSPSHFFLNLPEPRVKLQKSVIVKVTKNSNNCPCPILRKNNIFHGQIITSCHLVIQLRWAFWHSA
jgi:hypothetical protein